MVQWCLHRLATRPASIVLATIATVTLGTIYAGAHWLPIVTARHYRQALELASDDEAIEIARSLAHVGEAGCAQLVDALGSTRPEVRAAAITVLHEQLTAWRRQAPALTSLRLRQLADAFVRRAPKLKSPEARRAAVSLINRMLAWPGKDEQNGSHTVLAKLNAALRAAEGEGVAHRTGGSNNIHVRGADTSVAGQPPNQWTPADTSLPGGGLPVEVPNVAAASSTTGRAEPATTAEPSMPEPARPALLADRAQDPDAHSGPVSPEDTDALDGPRMRPVMPQQSQPVMNRGARIAASPDDLELLWNQPDQLTPFRLLKLAHSDDRQIAERAWRAIESRGLPQRELELGWYLTDPDPDVRRHWLDQLPQLAGIDAAPWLVALSRDDDAEVRRAAMTVMATSNDPQLWQRIEEMAHEDHEPQVQTEAARLAAERRAPRR